MKWERGKAKRGLKKNEIWLQANRNMAANLSEEREKEGSEEETGKASQTRQQKGSQRMEKRNLGLPKVTGNQSKVFLWMEHKKERATPSFLFVLKEDDPCRPCNHKVLISKKMVA